MPFRVNYLVNCLVDYCYVDERRVPLYFRHYPYMISECAKIEKYCDVYYE